MAINAFTWRITTNRVHLFSSLSQFSLIASFCVFLQKIRGSSHNFFNFIYIYIKLKLGTVKHICLKWVFLPQWSPFRSEFSMGSLSLHYCRFLRHYRQSLWHYCQSLLSYRWSLRWLVVRSLMSIVAWLTKHCETHIKHHETLVKQHIMATTRKTSRTTSKTWNTHKTLRNIMKHSPLDATILALDAVTLELIAAT